MCVSHHDRQETHTHAHTHTHTHAHTHIHTHTYTHTHIYIHTHTHTHTHMHTHTHDELTYHALHLVHHITMTGGCYDVMMTCNIACDLLLLLNLDLMASVTPWSNSPKIFSLQLVKFLYDSTSPVWFQLCINTEFINEQYIVLSVYCQTFET